MNSPEANESAPQRARQHLGDLGLADPGLAFEKQRPVKVQRQMHRRREAAIGDVIGTAEQREGVVDSGGESGHPQIIPIDRSFVRLERARAHAVCDGARSALDRRDLVRRSHCHHPRPVRAVDRREDRTKFSPDSGDVMRAARHAHQGALGRVETLIRQIGVEFCPALADPAGATHLAIANFEDAPFQLVRHDIFPVRKTTIMRRA